MNIDWNIIAQISAPIIALGVGAIINHLLSEREKLIAHYGHVSGFTLEPREEGQERTFVNTHSVVIRNAGRKTSHNVRVGHSFLPNIKIYPDIQYSIQGLPGGGKEIIFPTLIPKKEITIAYLYFAPDTYDQVNTHIESDDGPAKIVPVRLQAQVSKSTLALLWALVAYGAISVLYTLYVFLF